MPFRARLLAERSDTILAALGHPRALAELPATGRLAAWSDVPVSQQAVADRLFG